MKITLLLALLAPSIIAFGQDKGPAINSHLSQFHSLPETHVKMEGGDWISSVNHAGEKIILHGHHQILELLDPVQVYDSIYTWGWDTMSHGWLIDGKDIGITYDQNNNLLGYKSLIWDTISNSWKNGEQYIFSYDVNNNLTSNTSKIWNGSVWQNELKSTYTFDVNNNLTSEVSQLGNGSGWQTYLQDLYTYDVNNNQTSQTTQLWNGVGWSNSSLYTYTYDANNNLITILYQGSNGIGWDNYTLTSSTYDIHNNRTSETEQTWNVTDWYNYYRWISNFDEGNKLTSVMLQFWSGNDWGNYSRTLYTYDQHNNIMNVLSELWNSSDWDNGSLDIYDYDENNNQTNLRQYYWIGDAWGLYGHYADTYDANNFVLSSANRFYNDYGTDVTSGDSTYFYFHTIAVSVDHFAEDQNNISIYPNPSHGQFNINSNSFDKIEIFNLSGERVFTSNQGKSQTNIKIDLTQYGVGIYCVLIYDGQQVDTRKIVIQ